MFGQLNLCHKLEKISEDFLDICHLIIGCDLDHVVCSCLFGGCVVDDRDWLSFQMWNCSSWRLGVVSQECRTRGDGGSGGGGGGGLVWILETLQKTDIHNFWYVHDIIHMFEMSRFLDVHAGACHLERRLETLELQCRKQRSRPRTGGSVQTLPLGWTVWGK